MKKKISTILTVLLLIAMVIPMFATNVAAASTNFTRSTAVAASNGKLISVSTSDTNTRWYKIGVSKDGYAGINVSPTNGSVYVNVYAGKKVFFKNQGVNAGSTYSTNVGVPAGTVVYVGVTATTSEATQYTVQLTKKSSSKWEKEPNDTSSKATKMSLKYRQEDKKYYGAISYASDKDYFSYQATTDMNVRITSIPLTGSTSSDTTAVYTVKVNGVTKFNSAVDMTITNCISYIATVSLKSGDKVVISVSNATRPFIYQIGLTSRLYTTTQSTASSSMTSDGYTVVTKSDGTVEYRFNKLKVSSVLSVISNNQSTADLTENLVDNTALGGNICGSWLEGIIAHPNGGDNPYVTGSFSASTVAEGIAKYNEHILHQVPIYNTSQDMTIIGYQTVY